MLLARRRALDTKIFSKIYSVKHKHKRTGSEVWVPGHAVHEPAPMPENVFDWQLTQPARPATLYVPAVHGLHVEPSGNLPASQLSVVHCAAPYVKIYHQDYPCFHSSEDNRLHTCGEVVPGGQSEQPGCPGSPLYILAGQSTHDVLPASLYVPAEQSLQDPLSEN